MGGWVGGREGEGGWEGRGIGVVLCPVVPL